MALALALGMHSHEWAALKEPGCRWGFSQFIHAMN
jgi:hypothetical protein